MSDVYVTNPSRVRSVNGAQGDVVIGGTQILRGTNSFNFTSTGYWENSEWRRQSGGTGSLEIFDVGDSPDINIKRGVRVTSSNGNVDISQERIPIHKPEEYTISLYARKVSGNPRILVRAEFYPEPRKEMLLVREPIEDETWKRYIVRFTTTTDRNTFSLQFGIEGLSGEASGTIEICGMKLELGTVPTSWTPAPEDILSRLEELM